MTKKTMYVQLKEELDKLKVGGLISKTHLVRTIWGSVDYFKERSFDVYLNRYKRENPTKLFKVKGKIVRRLK